MSSIGTRKIHSNINWLIFRFSGSRIWHNGSVSGPRNWQNVSVSGPRSWLYGREILYQQEAGRFCNNLKKSNLRNSHNNISRIVSKIFNCYHILGTGGQGPIMTVSVTKEFDNRIMGTSLKVILFLHSFQLAPRSHCTLYYLDILTQAIFYTLISGKIQQDF